jgi:glycosyltransferase involved in cell wall biosynthesis
MGVHPTSVILCTHNRAELLPALIAQIRGQEYPADSFEIVVVDNCSTDQTAQVVEGCLAGPGAAVRYVREFRQGITNARNRGASEAYFPYLAYLDDDCSVGVDWLWQLMQGFGLHDEVEAVGGRVLPVWDELGPPSWMGPAVERWLAGNSHLGAQSRILEGNIRIIECNMALTRQAWESCGGFLGMEQFGSRHAAAGEVLYLLKQIERRGGKVAYVPEALVYHHVGRRPLRWMLWRAYWQGVSDGVLDWLLQKRSRVSSAGSIAVDSAALMALCGYTAFSYLKADSAIGVFNMLRAVRRLGLLLSKLRIQGDWRRVRAWVAVHGRPS